MGYQVPESPFQDLPEALVEEMLSQYKRLGETLSESFEEVLRYAVEAEREIERAYEEFRGKSDDVAEKNGRIVVGRQGANWGTQVWWSTPLPVKSISLSWESIAGLLASSHVMKVDGSLWSIAARLEAAKKGLASYFSRTVFKESERL